MSALTTQSATLSTVPASTAIAADQVGTANAPATGDRIQYVKLDLGVAGASAPVTTALPVTLATDADTSASGNITAAGQTLALALSGKGGVAIQVTGTWIGTLQFEGTVDGTTWQTVNAVIAGTTTIAPTTAASGLFRLTPAGLAQVRVNATAWTAGTAVISVRASAGTGGTFHNQALPAGTNLLGSVTESTGALPAMLFNMVTTQNELLGGILRELRITNQLLQSGLNVNDDLDVFRADPSYSLVS